MAAVTITHRAIDVAGRGDRQARPRDDMPRLRDAVLRIPSLGTPCPIQNPH